MLSTMQDGSLTVSALFRQGAALHHRVEVVTYDGQDVGRTTVGAVAARVRRLAAALRQLGVRPGDRVATFMWNTQAHLEAYLAVPGIGAVLHTLNVRLFVDDLAYVIEHAEDAIVLVDASLLETFAAVLQRLNGGQLRHVVVVGGSDPALPLDVLDYEDLLVSAEEDELADPDERTAAAMCYTSGTTGRPKGVVYSHRSIYLHSMVNCMASGFGIGESDRLLAAPAMFHANGWGFAYATWLVGATLILPGRYVQPEHLARLIASERPTVSGGVPTLWQDLLGYADDHAVDLSSLRVVSCSGSAVPPSLIDAYRRRGVGMLQAWGMTESSPLAAIARPPAAPAPEDELYYRTRTGRPVPGVELRTVAEDGRVLPNDGCSVGEVQMRGPWVTGRYYGDDNAARFDDGWLRTGDLGTIDELGFMKVTDRTKDVIKSGGEWISSTFLEGELMAHPDVAEAAVVGVADPRWEERPLVTVVLRPGASASAEQLREFLSGRIARWQLPERWARVEVIPKTGVGKFDKQAIRDRYARGGYDVELLG